MVDFWQEVIENPIKLAETVEKYYPLRKEVFYKLQQEILYEEDRLESAAMFYVLNRSSFSGTTLSGGMSPNHPRFTESSIDRVRSFEAKNLSVKCLDFEESIIKHRDKFLYCDPPYYIESNLYGNKGSEHKDFDHERLAKVLKSHDNWILSYNNCEYIRDLYKDYRFVYPSWTYGMGQDKESKEILVINLSE